MKSDKEFLDSVFAKRDEALSRRKIYRKRVYRFVTVSAACLALFAGAVQMNLFDALEFSVGTDGAAVEKTTSAGAAGDGVMTGEAYGDAAPQDNALTQGNGESSKASGQTDGYRMLPAASLTDTAGNSESCSGGEAVAEMERRAEALAEAGKAVKTDAPLENWQSDYALQVQVEREPQVFTYYYIKEEGDWNEEE